MTVQPTRRVAKKHSLRRQPAAASSAALQEGAQTACDLPNILRVLICERARCLPQRKHDMVAAPNDVAAVKGEPETLDL
jgi:hypothetical protein